MKFGIYVLRDEDGRGDKPFTQVNDILACRGVYSLFKSMGRFTKLELLKLGEYDNIKNTVVGLESPIVIDYDKVLYDDSLEHPEEYKGFDIKVPDSVVQDSLDEENK